MAAFVMSYPFSIDTANSKISTVYTDTDTYKAEQISAFLKTRKNERVLMPEFGIRDPVFDKFDVAAFSVDFLNFYPADKDIVLEEISLLKNAGVVTDVLIQFD